MVLFFKVAGEVSCEAKYISIASSNLTAFSTDRHPVHRAYVRFVA